MALGEAAVVAAPEVPEALVLQAGVLSVVRRFDEALALPIPLATTSAAAQKVVDTLYLAPSQYLDEVLRRCRAAVDAYRTHDSLTALAAAGSALGHNWQPDDLYVKAGRPYRDVSPFAIAWLAFQRGVLWSSAPPGARV